FGSTLPSEGIGWDMEATAIMKGTKNLDAAKKLADFAASEAANHDLYAKAYSVVAYPGAEQPLPNYPAGEEKLMIKNDFSWAAANRDKILEEWEKRYGSKDAPRNLTARALPNPTEDRSAVPVLPSRPDPRFGLRLPPGGLVGTRLLHPH